MAKKNLKLYRASAGSGKTYRLSLEFLKLLVANPHDYDKILAVTFTNKATAEMQMRILSDLFSVANGLDSNLISAIRGELSADGGSLSEEELKKRASEALSYILHDYNHFQVSTIDSFFQIILRNLAHELGLGAYINIVIDEKDLLTDAVDLMNEEFRDNPALRNWMNAYSAELLSDNKHWSLSEELLDFGKNIFHEVFKEHEGEMVKLLKNPNSLAIYKKKLQTLRAGEEKKILSVAADIDNLISSSGLTVEDFRGKGTFYTPIKKNKDFFSKTGKVKLDELIELTGTAQKAYDGDLSAYATKTSPKKSQIEALATSALIGKYRAFVDTRKDAMCKIFTCDLILAQLNNVGLLNDIARNVSHVKSRRMQFPLSETGSLLHSMIDETDTPFIYEKIGSFLEHIMIDEFQDTSQTQWKNFRPLVKECLDKGKMNLVVGDAKQSIYRFRNGDWSIIEGLDGEFPGNVSPIAAEDNWRSMERIVEFNNSLFAPTGDSGVSPILVPYQEKFGGEDTFRKLTSVYASAKQKCPKESQKGKGYILVQYAKDKDGELDCLVDQVLRVQREGVAAADITILVRRSKEIEDIAECFAQYRDEHKEELEKDGLNLDLISDEAFVLESSDALTMVVDAMRVILDPDDEISMLELFMLYAENAGLGNRMQILANIGYESDQKYKELMSKILGIGNLPLYEMAEELMSILEVEKMPMQSSFISKFLDLLTEYIQRQDPTLANFIDHWDKYLKQKKISMGDSADGIRIMTIHKSKGLEFHTVILPFCDSDVLSSSSNLKTLTWCDMKSMPASFEDFKAFPGSSPDSFPVWPIYLHAKSAEHSLFEAKYREELVQLLADCVNTLYVAFTRAVNNLVVICADKEAKKEPEIPKTCNVLLKTVLGEKLTNPSDLPEDSPLSLQYEVGELLPSEAEQRAAVTQNPFKQVPDPLVCEFHHWSGCASFKSSTKANEYIKEMVKPDEVQQSKKSIRRGTLLHALFSKIDTEDDIQKAAETLRTVDGLTSSKGEVEEIKKLASEKIKEHPEWFAPGLVTYKECSILAYDENKKPMMRRPDRVIKKGNKMIIVDFKTGKPHTSHQKQVDEYADLLQKMGYETETHLWYLFD